MTLAIAFKGPEGIVLAADSRVTLTSKNPKNGETLHVTYDNATKLLRVQGQEYVGAVIHGVAALGGASPRLIHSYLPELEESLKKEKRLTVVDFATRLGSFFHDQWKSTMPTKATGDVVFLVGGYNDGEPYGRLYEVKVPKHVKPVEKCPGPGEFGLSWGGQLEYTSRLLHGFDPKVVGLAKDHLKLSAKQAAKLKTHLNQNLGIPIPYQFLALQDCIDLSTLMIRTTSELMSFIIGKRGVGGAIDVAAITRTEGFQAIQQKNLIGTR